MNNMKPKFLCHDVAGPLEVLRSTSNPHHQRTPPSWRHLSCFCTREGAPLTSSPTAKSVPLMLVLLLLLPPTLGRGSGPQPTAPSPPSQAPTEAGDSSTVDDGSSVTETPAVDGRSSACRAEDFDGVGEIQKVLHFFKDG